MSDPDRSRLLWLDLETCSLDPRDPILEIGARVTTAKLDVIQDFSVVIQRQVFTAANGMETWVHGRLLVPVVAEMHRKSGLLAEVAESVITEEEAFAGLARFAGLYFSPSRGAMLCGNSIWYDRWFVRLQMHALEELVHHKVIDTTAIVEALRTCAGFDYPSTLEQSKHRAMSDIDNAIERLRWALQRLL